MAKEKATIHVQAKLTPSEFEPFQKVMEETGIKQATLIRQVLLANKEFIVEPKETPKDKARLLFLANKSSNNINQLAKRVHQAYRADVVSQRLYMETLNGLKSIQHLMTEAVKKC
ncbi:relaxosome NikA [Vibrio vulnificus]|uniref:hypothetical protein n=1 Tax=Vibrio vulnificus TaxID=672 RepID=UPI004059941F